MQVGVHVHMCAGACVCRVVHVYVYMHECVYMWRSEINIRCCSSGVDYLVFWDTVFHWDLELNVSLDWMAVESQRSSGLCRPSTLPLQCMPPHPAFCMYYGDQTQVLMFIQQALGQLRHLSSPSLPFLFLFCWYKIYSMITISYYFPFTLFQHWIPSNFLIIKNYSFASQILNI